MNSCDTCKFWEHDEDDDEGWCRRRAPRPYRIPLDEDGSLHITRAMWPLTDANQWCGEWDAIPLIPHGP